MALRFLQLALVLPLTLANGWQTFVVPHSFDRSADDAPLLTKTLASGSLSSNTTILFEKGITYNVFSPVTFPVLHNVEIVIEGNLSYPVDIGAIQCAFYRLY